jgi:hypothetical protein
MTKQTNNSSTRSRIVKRIAGRSLLVLFLFVFLFVGLALYVRLGLDGRGAARLIIPRIESAIGKHVRYSSATLV